MRTTASFRGQQCGVAYAEGFAPCVRWLRATTYRLLP
jgi:N-acetylglucosamine malate deacetylase 1